MVGNSIFSGCYNKPGRRTCGTAHTGRREGRRRPRASGGARAGATMRDAARARGGPGKGGEETSRRTARIAPRPRPPRAPGPKRRPRCREGRAEADRRPASDRVAKRSLPSGIAKQDREGGKTVPDHGGNSERAPCAGWDRDADEADAGVTSRGRGDARDRPHAACASGPAIGDRFSRDAAACVDGARSVPMRRPRAAPARTSRSRRGRVRRCGCGRIRPSGGRRSCRRRCRRCGRLRRWPRWSSR